MKLAPKRNGLVLLLVIVGALVLGACTDDATPTSSAPASTDAQVTTTDAPDPNGFGETVLPVLEENCATCHNEGGPGSPHWQLSTAADAVAVAPFMRDYVAEGEMPPWPASDLSVAFANDRSLTAEEIAAVVDWVDNGAALDIDPTTPIQADALVGLAEADAVLASAEPYQGSTDVEDDYRCLIFDPALSEEAWVTAYDFVPDQAVITHHAIGYVLPGDMRAAADAKQAEDGLPGWTCYGGSGLGADEMFIGWAPGQGASYYPEGSGLRLEPGDFVVMQIHYHYDNSAPADQSQLLIDYAPDGTDLDELSIIPYLAPAEIPCATWEEGPLCDRDAAMAHALERFGRSGVRADQINLICRANPGDFADMTDGTASSHCTLPAYGFGEIVGVLGHEHEIGTSFRMTLNPGRDDEVVLLDIPDWDFDWQYNYELVEAIEVNPGDTVRLDCSWDRALRDASLEPSYVLWADGTNDEMCFATMVVRDRS